MNVVNVRLNTATLRTPAVVRPRIRAALDRHLTERARLAVYLTFRPDPSDDPRATKLTGVPYMRKGEAWPVCDRCGRPLHHLFQVNFATAGLPALEGVDLLTFFYCIGCSPEDHTEPGWTVWLRPSTDQPAIRPELSPVPPQADQPLPIILLSSAPQTATVRPGPDLPAPFDPALRELMASLTGDRRWADALEYGCTRYARIGLVSRETGEQSELILPMTPAPSPFEQSPPPPDLFPNHHLLYLEIHPIPQPRRPMKDPWRGYDAYMRRLHNAEHPISKIGGWVYGTQDPRYTHCACGEPLEHILTIGTTNETPFVVGDLGGIYLAGCPSPTCTQNHLVWWVDWS